LVEFDYHGRHRRAEPYSLRQARTGNVLLYAWEQGATTIKAFNIAEIEALRPTSASFAPRYRIEFSAESAALVLPAATTTSRPAARYPSSRHRTRSMGGVQYVFQCPYCSRQFRHSTDDPKLGKHKMKDRFTECPGRDGYLVRMV
jgi:predicted DNA-binding transcriptional regulator YafY